MGYTTDFSGSVAVVPALNAEEIAYLKKFAQSRRVHCTQGPYFVDRSGDFFGQGSEGVLNFNAAPEGQPGLWCQWIPTDDGTKIEWDGGEKFYGAASWMKYIIDHFIGPNPIAKTALPFLHGHTCNGEIEAQGEESDDKWLLIVKDNIVSIAESKPTEYGEPTPV